MTPRFDEAGYQVVEGLLSARQVYELRTATGRYRDELRAHVPEGIRVSWDAMRMRKTGACS